MPYWKCAPSTLKDQMLMRIDEIGEDYEILKHKILAYTLNKVESGKTGATPMEVDLVDDGYEDWMDEGDEDGGNIDEVRNMQCYDCGKYGHLARDCPHADMGQTQGEGQGQRQRQGLQGFRQGRLQR